MNSRSEQLAAIIQPAVHALECEFVGHELHMNGSRWLLRIYIDRVGGVTVDDCARVSRQISAALDVEDVITHAYDLEVSSPGLARPLFTLEHYRQFLGSCVHARLAQPKEGRRNFTGLLQAVEGNQIILVVDGQTVVLSFEEIAKANLEV